MRSPRSFARRSWLGIQTRIGPGGVGLTFDDGPQPGSTELVLDALATLEVPATFFCVGRDAVRHPRIIERIIAEGHGIGSHSCTHPHPRSASLEELTSDYLAGRSAVEDAAGKAIPLFRPPHGYLGIRTATMLRRQRFNTWLWTIDPEDWRADTTASEVGTTGASATSGDVILLHDWIQQPHSPAALDRRSTVAALPSIVADVRARNLEFRVLPAG